MPSLAATILVAVLQQTIAHTPGQTSPPDGDTTGYWQQGITYRITATLDEAGQRVRARGTLRYVNHSPDTLRAMFFHQYLNAFRPASAWSEADEREGRERFQHLRDPDYGYERFTAPIRVNGTPVVARYPGAPDSTVVRVELPAPLAPGDSLTVEFAWDARPSTVARRQARRGRHWDLAQWYPKVAVYDRGGWEPNALRPAGEFYGEFGTYDVTLVLPEDQVVGATGVPVSGDPGWSRVARAGTVRTNAMAYGAVPAAPTVEVPAGFRAVRFLARDVHHFAWSASPDYRYEGGPYVRPAGDRRWPTWDTVSVHVLYRADDDTTWGGLRVVRRTQAAMRWLESIYGTYAYPQMTVLHRVDGGGTEFPMMLMNGSPSQGLILHEGGHNWTYGILANNEWRSGWMDEGFTSYQTDWAQSFTPQERVRNGLEDRFAPAVGYRAHAVRMALPRFERTALGEVITDLQGDAQSIGTVAHEFRDFGTYNEMIYTRAQVMYGQLRDALGDSLWVEFLHDYYSRWALRHVDERAMRASAERVSGRDFGWFFEQWVHRTGVTDYALGKVRTRESDGGWITEAEVRRRGQYRHPVSVGVRTSAGWTVARADGAPLDAGTVVVRTAERPWEVRLDPYHFTWDWDRRNDVKGGGGGARDVLDWPFLAQADRERSLRLWRPMGWYSEPGGVTLGVRSRTNYLGWLDQWEFGAVSATRSDIRGEPLDVGDRIQGWLRVSNPYLSFMRRPAVGWSGGVAALDDVFAADVAYQDNVTSGTRARTNRWALTYTTNTGRQLLPELWTPGGWLDLSWSNRLDWTRGDSRYFVDARLVGGANGGETFWKPEFATGVTRTFSGATTLAARLYVAGVGGDSAPPRRGLFLSADDPVATFGNHWWRPRGSILKQTAVAWLPLGGAGMRGYHWSVDATGVAAANVELAHRAGEMRGAFGAIALWPGVFADGGNVSTGILRTEWFGDAGVGVSLTNEWLSDAGVGVSLKGRFYDRPINVRIDFPVWVSEPSLAIDRGRAGAGRFAPRWAISFNDLW